MFQTLKNRAREIAIVGAVSVPTLALANVGSSASTAFNSALTDATAAVGSYAAALVGLAAVGVVFMIAVKYVKRIRGAA